MPCLSTCSAFAAPAPLRRRHDAECLRAADDSCVTAAPAHRAGTASSLWWTASGAWRPSGPWKRTQRARPTTCSRSSEEQRSSPRGPLLPPGPRTGAAPARPPLPAIASVRHACCAAFIASELRVCIAELLPDAFLPARDRMSRATLGVAQRCCTARAQSARVRRMNRRQSSVHSESRSSAPNASSNGSGITGAHAPT